MYGVLFRLYCYGLDCVVRVRGLCRMVVKFGGFRKKRNHEISEMEFRVGGADGNELEDTRDRKKS